VCIECDYRPIHGDVKVDSNCNGIYVSIAVVHLFNTNLLLLRDVVYFVTL